MVDGVRRRSAALSGVGVVLPLFEVGPHGGDVFLVDAVGFEFAVRFVNDG